MRLILIFFLIEPPAPPRDKRPRVKIYLKINLVRDLELLHQITAALVLDLKKHLGVITAAKLTQSRKMNRNPTKQAKLLFEHHSPSSFSKCN